MWIVVSGLFFLISRRCRENFSGSWSRPNQEYVHLGVSFLPPLILGKSSLSRGNCSIILFLSVREILMCFITDISSVCSIMNGLVSIYCRICTYSSMGGSVEEPFSLFGS